MWFSRMLRSFSLAKTILKGMVNGEEELTDGSGEKTIFKNGQGCTLTT